MATNETPEQSDLWELFRFFLGEWSGTGTGKPGVSSVERSYALTLADQFIEVRSRSVYAPQESNLSGEVHEELGLISYDKVRSCYVLREFHVEGYVNQYVLEPPVPGENKLVFLPRPLRTSLQVGAPGRRSRSSPKTGSERPLISLGRAKNGPPASPASFRGPARCVYQTPTESSKTL